MPLYKLIDSYEVNAYTRSKKSAIDLPFEMQDQITPNWCWAATVASLENYAKWTDDKGNKKKKLSNKDKVITSQCVVAARDLNLTSACCETIVKDGKESPQKVTKEWDVQNALSAPLNQAGLHQRTVRGRPNWDDVLASIESNYMPVCCRIVWEDELRGAHFVAISAVSPSSKSKDIRIDDSLYGRIVVPFDAFLRVYHPNEKNGGGAKRGRVSHTYYLQRP